MSGPQMGVMYAAAQSAGVKCSTKDGSEKPHVHAIACIQAHRQQRVRQHKLCFEAMLCEGGRAGLAQATIDSCSQHMYFHSQTPNRTI